MRNSRASFRSIFDNPVIVGATTIFVVAVAVFLSYIAENGLPFVPTYNLSVQVADGGELNKNADVRIGGARVGQVLKVLPEPANAAYPHPYAQLQIAINHDLEPLPADTTYQVRLASVLGGQYLELFPGHPGPGASAIPNGGRLTIASRPAPGVTASTALGHDVPYVDLSTAFNVFGPRTQQGIRAVSEGLGEAFAGRGTQLNDATYAFARLLDPLRRVFDTFASPQTQLGQFFSGLAATTAAIAPEADSLTDLFAHGATTAGALDVPALGQTLDQLPSTEVSGAAVLNRATPVLSELASITAQLQPAAGYLPVAAGRLDTVLRAAGPTLSLLSPVSSRLSTALNAATRIARDPASTQAFHVLGVNDLGTAGSSAFLGIGAILNTVSSAQFACDVVPLWLRNFASVLSEGNSSGNWLRISTLIDPNQLVSPSSGTPSSDLHVDFNPQEGGGQCQAGNEVYTGAQAIDNPGRTSAQHDPTAPPIGVYPLAERAGLVPYDPTVK